jgi:3-hydroxyisobutyrate dehydrogenase-like beta-hydroxyacid dehydrogenase
MTTIGLLHPGAMGAAVGAALTAAGREVLWASDGRSEATGARAAGAGLADARTVAGLLERSDVVLSICPPHAALEVAAQAAGFGGVFVDCNAIAPATAHEVARIVEDGGAAYVDGGIVGSPPAPDRGTRLYLAGARSDAVASLFDGTPVAARVLGADPTAASALKMAYAAWTKGSAALLLAARAAAERLGVEEALLAEWAHSLPDLPARAERAAADAGDKGWRWVGEMEEIARTFADAGLPAGFHRAAAEVFAAGERPGARAD